MRHEAAGISATTYDHRKANDAAEPWMVQVSFNHHNDVTLPGGVAAHGETIADALARLGVSLAATRGI